MQTEAQKIDIVRDAIRSRKQLTFFAGQKYREACPHILGTKGTRWHMLAWQFGGETTSKFSASGERWRCFELDDMTDVRSRVGDWYRGWTTGRGGGGSTCVDREDTIIDAAYAAEVRR